MRHRFVSLLLALAACTPSPSPVAEIEGVWRDDAAAFTTCGETYPVATVLDLEQTASTLEGTFTLQEAVFPFTGKVDAARITGEVRGDDGSSLTAALMFRQNRLTGTLSAAEATACTAGGASVSVYRVNLVRD